MRFDFAGYQSLEAQLQCGKLPAYPLQEERALLLLERVSEAQRYAMREMRETEQHKNKHGKKRKRKDGNGAEDADGDLDA